ncbi:S-adenosylmethionine decarboxylase [Eremomyces bilateralis CBS 781.70]|uniref:adenosylmethionine decarboxylase n=1 Tax=Eremomyces bilateralis CBS 781.70 TaxID=1392243 RepID=A0A6G1G724_9PEZI|nr:S-adenosylmethionine decarboxylase [Eremomyces bilateralis CBS 781.70]KAF1813736.1 S-adenosylmethionine decarboxylase [Eremomyces bilateralis CBS 781.70]
MRREDLVRILSKPGKYVSESTRSRPPRYRHDYAAKGLFSTPLCSPSLTAFSVLLRRLRWVEPAVLLPIVRGPPLLRRTDSCSSGWQRELTTPLSPMVALDINHIGTPASFVGTPSVSINHEAIKDLDSSNAFEGPEKLLEVWFSATAHDLPAGVAPNGLKAVSEDTWKEMLDLVSCKVLSIVKSEHVDAYLLSESSMFVWPHKLVLKTCGTTTLLYGIPRMLEIAFQDVGFAGVPADPHKGLLAAAVPYRVFYSRKNFLFPDRQHGPHRSWGDEVRYLDKTFNGGSAYMIGKMNGEHWFLYVTNPPLGLPLPTASGAADASDPLAQSMAPEVLFPHIPSDEQEDETLEILMTDLDEENAKQFYVAEAELTAQRLRHKVSPSRVSPFPANVKSPYTPADCTFDASSDVSTTTSASPSEKSDLDDDKGHALGTVVSDTCGLADIYPTADFPNARVDAYLFPPCGFSANGVIPVTAPNPKSTTPSSPSETHYFTVHVTPEPGFSYASFETNVPARQGGRQTADLVAQVVKIFKPGRFSVTLFEARVRSEERGGGAEGGRASGNARMEEIPGYKRVERIVHYLDGYDLVFRYYERLGWMGGPVRVGERGY